jgi:hypothetical protein
MDYKNPMGMELDDMLYFQAPNTDASALVGYFGKEQKNLSSITITFKATPTSLESNHRVEKKVYRGSVHSGFYDMYSDLKPMFLDELHDLFASLPEDVPVSLIGNAEGGVMATFAAVEMAEVYPHLNLILITVNTFRKWSKRYASRIDKIIPKVYRWREVPYIAYGTGEEAYDNQSNEIWNVYWDRRCCPQPETKACREGRGAVGNEKDFPWMCI